MSDVTAREAADLLGVTPRRVLQLIASGALTPRRKLPGTTGAYLIATTEVERYLSRQ